MNIYNGLVNQKFEKSGGGYLVPQGLCLSVGVIPNFTVPVRIYHGNKGKSIEYQENLKSYVSFALIQWRIHKKKYSKNSQHPSYR